MRGIGIARLCRNDWQPWRNGAASGCGITGDGRLHDACSIDAHRNGASNARVVEGRAGRVECKHGGEECGRRHECERGITCDKRRHRRRHTSKIELTADQPCEFCRRFIDDRNHDLFKLWWATHHARECIVSRKAPSSSRSAIHEPKWSIANRSGGKWMRTPTSTRHTVQQMLWNDRQLRKNRWQCCQWLLECDAQQCVRERLDALDDLQVARSR